MSIIFFIVNKFYLYILCIVKNIDIIKVRNKNFFKMYKKRNRRNIMKKIKNALLLIVSVKFTGVLKDI